MTMPEHMTRELAEITMRQLASLADKLKGDDQEIALNGILAIRWLLTKADNTIRSPPSGK